MMETMNNILVNNINEYDSINNHDNYIRDSSNKMVLLMNITMMLMIMLMMMTMMVMLQCIN